MLTSILDFQKCQTPVTVFADDNKKYLSTDLGKEMVKNKEFISNQIYFHNC